VRWLLGLREPAALPPVYSNLPLDKSESPERTETDLDLMRASSVCSQALLMSPTQFKLEFFEVSMLDEVVEASNSNEQPSHPGRTRRQRIPAVDDGLLRLVERPTHLGRRQAARGLKSARQGC
jgi:hypothetical protein